MKDFKSWGIRIREDSTKNYYSIWDNLETTRIDLGETYELDPEKSEFYDISITTRCGLGCKFCLTGDTLIQTPSGSKYIKDLTLGEKVISWNSETEDYEEKEITQLHSRPYSGKLIILELESGETLQITPNHKIYTTNRGWISASKLTETDEILYINE